MSGPRYSIIPGDAIFDKRLTPTNLRVLGAIGRHSNDNGWCWVSQTKMAVALDVSRGAVNKSIGLLIEYGYLEKRNRKRADGGNTSCDYRVLLDRPDHPDEGPDMTEAGSGTDQEPDRNTEQGVSSQDDRGLSSPEVTGGVISRDDRGLSSLEVTTRTATEITAPKNGSAADRGSGLSGCDETNPPDPFDWAEGMRAELGLPPARNPIAEMKQVQAWLADGIDLDKVARPTILAVAETKTGEPAQSLRYFDGPVRDAHATPAVTRVTNRGGGKSVGSAAYGASPSQIAERRAHALETGVWYSVWTDPPDDIQALIDEGRIKVTEHQSRTAGQEA